MAKPTTIKKQKSNSEDFIDLRGVFKKALYHWPLYLIMMAIALVASYLYLRYTDPIYISYARIYVKDERNTGAAHNSLENLAMGYNNKVVENEMEVLKSPIILQDVIEEHNFNIRYFVKGKVGQKELYENRPITLKVLSDSVKVGYHRFNIEILNNNQLKVNMPSKGGGKEDVITFSRQSGQPFLANKDQFALFYDPQLNPGGESNFLVTVDSINPLSYQKVAEINTGIVNRGGSIIQITYEDVIPERCADFINAIAQKYNDYTLSDKNAITLNTIQFISDRLDSLGQELNIVERNVEAFKKERGLTEIGENSRIILDQAREADQRLTEANIQMSIFDEVERYINNPNSVTLTPSGNVDPALTNMINRFQELQTEKQRLSLSAQPENPILQNVEKQIEASRTAIKNYIAGFRRNMATARSGLQRKVNQIESRISQVPTYERQFIDIKRQQSVKEQLYLYLLQKKEEASVAFASNIVDNKIISPAYIPTTPIRPRRMLIRIGFIIGAFILASIYLYLKYLLNSKLVSKKQIEKITGLPVIAEVFNYAENSKLSTAGDRSLLTEQILNLRNNLKFLLGSIEQSPVILLTSSISGEGKTFLTSHIGRALTSNNRRVILIELDLRKPKLSSSVGVSNASGITNYIIKSETIEQIIKKVPGEDRLFIIPSGPIPPNPIEMLESERLNNLISQLRQQYDYVIIDTSPLGLVTDAKSLSPAVDCTLVVTRFNYTPRPKFEELMDDVDASTFKKMGIIFNGVDPDSSYSTYGYGYGYSGYGYGYGQSAMVKKSFSARLRAFAGRFY